MKQVFLTVINAKKGGTAHVLLDGYISTYSNSHKEVSTKLRALAKDHSKIILDINSGGGSVIEGIATINSFKSIDAQIETRVVGMAASMGGVYAISGDYRTAYKNTNIMLHKVTSGAYGTSKELRDTADMVDKWENSIVKTIESKTEMSEGEIRDKFFIEGKDVWLSADEAKDFGLIDEVLDAPEESEEQPENYKELDIRARQDFHSFDIAARYKDPKDPKNIKIVPKIDTNLVNVLEDLEQEIQASKKDPKEIANLISTTIKNHIKTEPQKEPKNMNLKATAISLGLPENATEDQVNARQTEIVAENKRLKDAAETATNEKVTALIKGAIDAGQIVAADKEKFEKMAKNDFETTSSVIATLPKKESLSNSLERTTPSNGNGEYKDYTYAKFQEEGLTEELERIQNEEPERFEKLVDAHYAK